MGPLTFRYLQLAIAEVFGLHLCTAGERWVPRSAFGRPVRMFVPLHTGGTCGPLAGGELVAATEEAWSSLLEDDRLIGPVFNPSRTLQIFQRDTGPEVLDRQRCDSYCTDDPTQLLEHVGHEGLGCDRQTQSVTDCIDHAWALRSLANLLGRRNQGLQELT